MYITILMEKMQDVRHILYNRKIPICFIKTTGNIYAYSRITFQAKVNKKLKDTIPIESGYQTR